jgi:hypothetical protein
MPQRPHSLWVQTAHVYKPRAFMWLSVVHVLAVGLDLSVSPDLTQYTWAFVPCICLFDKWRCTESKVLCGRRIPVRPECQTARNPYKQHIIDSCLLQQQQVPMYMQHLTTHQHAQNVSDDVRQNQSLSNGTQVGRRGGVHAHGSLRIGVQVRRDSTRSSQIGGHRSGTPLKPPTRSKIGRTNTSV